MLLALCRMLATVSAETDGAIAPGEPVPPAHTAGALTKLKASLSPSSFWFLYAVRFSLAVGAGLAVGRSLGLEKGYWVLITIAVVVKPQLSLSATSTIHRVAGTVLGALLSILVVITVSSAWGLTAVMFALAVVGISVLRVNYGLAVVFITPLVIVLLNVAAPGHWQVADIRVVNTLLGAAIGLIATVAILPGSERGLLNERSRAALADCARYLRAIGHESPQERLAARRSARAATDDLLAVVDRAMAEPTTVGGTYLNAASRISAAVAELWDQEAWLALSVPADQMTPAVCGQIDNAAERIERMTRVLSGSDLMVRGEAGRSPGDTTGPARTDALPGSLIEAIGSVEIACAHLGRTSPRASGVDAPR